MIIESAYEVGSKEIVVADYLLSRGEPISVLDRTGFERVYKLEAGQNEFDLIEKALEKLKKTPLKEIDTLICVTQSNRFQIPGFGVRLAEKLGIPDLRVWDINDGCTGFLTALDLADLLIKHGQSIKTLICCFDIYSDSVEEGDRSTYTIFSDVASLTYVNNQECLIKYKEKLIHDKWSLIHNENSVFKMNGLGVLNLFKAEFKEFIEKAMSDLDLSINESHTFYIHQASKIAIETLNKHFPYRNIKFEKNLPGNLTSSTIPALLSENLDDINRNKKSVIMISFGIGMKINLMQYVAH